MRAPFLFLFHGQLACLALLIPSLALAQHPPPSVFAGAADAAAPMVPPVYEGITPHPLQAGQLGLQDWRAANAAVSDFPRGHADIVVWEAAQTQTNPVATDVPAAPARHGDPAAGQSNPAHGAHPPAMHLQPPLTGQP